MMKKLGTSLVVALALCVALMGTALANGKNKRKTVNLDQDVMINNQLVKKGTYEIKFVATDNQIMIMKKDDVVATAKVNVKQNTVKAPYNSLSFTTTDKGKLLTAITFAGDNRTLHLNELENASSGE